MFFIFDTFFVFLIWIMPTSGNADIAICDFDSREDKTTTKVRENHHNYAQIHNYAYVQQRESLAMSRLPHWTKVALIRKTLHNHEWVMWLDGDAIFIDTKKSIESHILSRYGIHYENITVNSTMTSHRSKADKISLIFSGDTLAINSGVMLFRRSKWSFDFLDEVWKVGELLENKPLIGCGIDNAAIAIVLSGCNSNSTYEQCRQCYQNVDLGFKDGSRYAPIAERISHADITIYQKMIPPRILKHILPVPQTLFQSYSKDTAEFIIHFAGHGEARSWALEDAANHFKLASFLS